MKFVLFIAIYLFARSNGQKPTKPFLKLDRLLEVPCNETICTGPLSNIYCHGPILTSAWQFGLQKTCPGDKLRVSAKEVLANFEKLKLPIYKAEFEEFCKNNFEEKHYLVTVKLKDWIPNPKFLTEIKNEEHKKLASEIHDRWERLARVFTQDVIQNSELYPLIPVKNPFVVPGGRFDVYFYWDTFWIIKGLLVSEMFETVEGIISNFSELINELGYVPNSGNLQLMRRSQPPLFSHMVWEYTRITQKLNKKWMLSMKKELEFWESNRTTSVDGNLLYLYKTSSNCPRPENFESDYQLGIHTLNPSNVWRSISSACESGWDFSSRWMHRNTSDLSSIHTDKIIPVDLNVIIANNYRYLAYYAEQLGDAKLSSDSNQKFASLKTAIMKVLWSEELGAWFDFDTVDATKNVNFYPSNVYPLMIPGFEKYSAKVEQYVKSCGALDFHGGIPSSLPSQSSQQWDFPNVWAPNQHFVIQSFLNSNSSFLREQAQNQALVFIETVFNGLYNPKTGRESGIWEKYDARSTDGEPGAGGEYVVQEGFGWTNGAVLDLIWAFKAHSRMKKDGNLELTSNEYSAIVYTAVAFCAIVAIVFLSKGIICRREVNPDDREAGENLLRNEEEQEDI